MHMYRTYNILEFNSSYFRNAGQDDFIEVVSRELIFLPLLANEPQCDEIRIEVDDILENIESFQVILSPSDIAVTIDPRTATVRILNDDRKSAF